MALESERYRGLPTPKVLGNRNRGYMWASYIPWVPLEVAHAPLGRHCDFHFSGFRPAGQQTGVLRGSLRSAREGHTAVGSSLDGNTPKAPRKHLFQILGRKLTISGFGTDLQVQVSGLQSLTVHKGPRKKTTCGAPLLMSS